jgi:pentatricopeptide repeat protein
VSIGDVRRRPRDARYIKTAAAVVSGKELSTTPQFQKVAKSVSEFLKPKKESQNLAFGTKEMRIARLYLLEIVSRQRCTEPRIINQAFVLLERVITEISILHDKQNTRGDGRGRTIDWWFCDHRTFNPILNLWKQSVTDNVHLKPRQLLFRLIALTRKVPFHFNLNHMTVSILLEAILLTESRKVAPELMEEVLEILQNELPPNQRHRVHPPNEYICTQLLLAWSNSDLPNAKEMIERICHNMEQDEIPFTIVTYGVLIRFYGKLRDTQKLDHLFNALKREKEKVGLENSKETSTEANQVHHPNSQLRPNVIALSEAIYGYSTGDQIEKAEQIIQQMLRLKPNTKQEEQLFGRSILTVLMAYRYTYKNPLCTSRARHNAVHKASKFYERNKDCTYLSDWQKCKWRSAS